MTPIPIATAMTALRSLSITEILSVAVPTRPTVAIDQRATEQFEASAQLNRSDELMAIRSGGAVPTPAHSHLLFTSALCPVFDESNPSNRKHLFGSARLGV
jgi:hypothetical protein